MNNYELHIETLGGVWELVDLGENRPFISYQSVDVNDFESRKANYSQNLSIPFTAKNQKIFGYANLPDAVGAEPYRRFNIRLYDGVNVILGAGACLILLNTSDVYEVQLLSGVSGLFDQLKELSMSDLDLGDKTIVSISANSMRTENFNEFYIFGLSTFEVGGSSVIREGGVGRLLPYFHFYNIVKRMLLNLGYTLSTNLDEDDTYGLAYTYISCATPSKAYLSDLSPDSIFFSNSPYRNQYDGFRSFSFSLSTPNLQVSWGLRNVDTRHGFSDLYNVLIYNPPYTVQGNITVTFFMPVDVFPFNGVTLSVEVYYCHKVTGDFTYATGREIRIYDVNATIGIGLTVHSQSVFFPNIQIGEDYDLYMIVQAKRTDGGIVSSGIVTAIASYQSFARVGKSVISDSKIRVGDAIGFDTQFDLVKAFFQTYGLVVTVDELSKIVHAYTLRKLYENTANGLDWSNKVDAYQVAKTTYQYPSIAQVNYMTMTENTSDGVNVKGSFNVDNKALQKSSDFVALPFESGLENVASVGDSSNFQLVANIPSFEYDPEKPTEEPKIKDTKPHLVLRSGNTWTYYITGHSYEQYAKLNHISPQTLLDKYYADLTGNLLSRVKIIEEKLFLTSQDVATFNQLTPVYINKYGAWFFVNKISNYKSGELTTVELIQL